MRKQWHCETAFDPIRCGLKRLCAIVLIQLPIVPSHVHHEGYHAHFDMLIGYDCSQDRMASLNPTTQRIDLPTSPKRQLESTQALPGDCPTSSYLTAVGRPFKYSRDCADVYHVVAQVARGCAEERIDGKGVAACDSRNGGGPYRK